MVVVLTGEERTGREKGKGRRRRKMTGVVVVCVGAGGGGDWWEKTERGRGRERIEEKTEWGEREGGKMIGGKGILGSL